MELGTEFPVYRRTVTIDRGEGAWLFGSCGKQYLDLYAGHAVAALGYADTGLVNALKDAAERLFFQSNAVETDTRIQAIQELTACIGDRAWGVLLVNSGAEANENALRLAFKHTRRPAIAAVRGAFHGRTAAAAAVTTGCESWYGFPRAPFEVRWIEFDDPKTANVIDDSVAAVIVEPIQGVAGARAVPLPVLEAIQMRAEAVGCLVIADEVQCGMGRAGLPCAYQTTSLRPDIVTLGKGIAAGFPAGAVLARPELLHEVKIGEFGTTFGGSPMACRMINEVCTRVQSFGFLENVRKIGERLATETLGKRISSTTGRGMMIGLRTNEPAGKLQADLLNQGILVGDAKDPHVVRILPPLILNDAHVDHFVMALKEVGN